MSDTKLQSVELLADDGKHYIDFSPPVMLSELGDRLPGLIDVALGWPAGYRVCVQWTKPPAEVVEASSYDDPEVFKHQGVFSDAEFDRPMTPDTNMVERVAAALAKLSELVWTNMEDDATSIEEGRNYWRVRARAAIEAMREPTEAMVAAPYHEGDGCDAQYQNDEDFAGAWEAMIDTALAEGPKT